MWDDKICFLFCNTFVFRYIIPIAMSWSTSILCIYTHEMVAKMAGFSIDIDFHIMLHSNLNLPISDLNLCLAVGHFDATLSGPAYQPLQQGRQ